MSAIGVPTKPIFADMVEIESVHIGGSDIGGNRRKENGEPKIQSWPQHSRFLGIIGVERPERRGFFYQDVEDRSYETIKNI